MTLADQIVVFASFAVIGTIGLLFGGMLVDRNSQLTSPGARAVGLVFFVSLLFLALRLLAICWKGYTL